MRELLREFKEFAVKGNVVDLAVGLIIGGAFGKIVSSLVSDILMPPIGLLIGGVDFSNLKIVLKAAENGIPAVTFNYGMFIQHIIDFTIVAAAVFLLVKLINRLKREVVEDEKNAPAPKEEVVLLQEIRDVLKSQK